MWFWWPVWWGGGYEPMIDVLGFYSFGADNMCVCVSVCMCVCVCREFAVGFVEKSYTIYYYHLECG